MLNSLARLTILNPKTFLAGLAASLALNVALVLGVTYTSHEVDHWRTRATLSETTVTAQTTAARAIASAATLRAETAERAVQYAAEIGKADRRAAEVYLSLPTPQPEVRCDAAQALVDEAVKENRQ